MKRRIFDAPQVAAFLVLFLATALLPFGLVFARAGALTGLSLEKPLNEKKCIEDIATMRASHMTMLDSWRTDVVRGGNLTYISSSGIAHDKSLTKTCMDCHKDEKKFCTACHNYMGVANNCFTCHVAPGKE